MFAQEGNKWPSGLHKAGRPRRARKKMTGINDYGDIEKQVRTPYKVAFKAKPLGNLPSDFEDRRKGVSKRQSIVNGPKELVSASIRGIRRRQA